MQHTFGLGISLNISMQTCQQSIVIHSAVKVKLELVGAHHSFPLSCEYRLYIVHILSQSSLNSLFQGVCYCEVPFSVHLHCISLWAWMWYITHVYNASVSPMSVLIAQVFFPALKTAGHFFNLLLWDFGPKLCSRSSFSRTRCSWSINYQE